MDELFEVTEADYAVVEEQERLPLVTLDEVREVVELLAVLGRGATSPDDAFRAGRLAGALARRLPSVA